MDAAVMDAAQILAALGTPEGRTDPYPLYAALHELGEVIKLSEHDVLVVGYDDINLVLRDPGFLVTDEATLDEGIPAWRDNPVFLQSVDWILNLNAPRHARIRSLLAKTFTARRVVGMRPAIEAMADDLLDAMADRGANGSAVEFMQDFAYLLPVTVICELIGIPDIDRAGFWPLARDLAGIFEMHDLEALPRINAAAVELLSYFTDLAAQRRSDPRGDLLSDLLAVSDEADGRLTDAELLHNMTLLLVAGFETTTNLLGNGLQIVLDRPEYVEGVGAGSVPPAAFVEESAPLRFTRPAHQPPWLRHDHQRCCRLSAVRGCAAARGGQPGPAKVRQRAQLRPRARRWRPAQLRRRCALLHRCRAGQARRRGCVPSAVRPVPEDSPGRRANPPGYVVAARIRHAAGVGGLTCAVSPLTARQSSPSP
ncbi:MAG TPA: cytochrome P450 [Streptosporangiaceae bacterium]|jgi:cytochrome P450|nr:cytochrome P450 [Streptosporangiaceae bacterium]